MYSYKRNRITLMPVLSLAALSALIAIPALSQSKLYAAGPTHRVTVTVKGGESLWNIADRFTPSGESTQETIDRIMETNHLVGPTIVPGERLIIVR